MNRIALLTLVAVAFVIAAGSARASEPAPDGSEVANKTCPVMAGEAVDPNIYVDYRGKRVWFCCDSCVQDFKADPQAYLAALPQFAGEVGEAGEAGDTGAAPEAGDGPDEDHGLGGLHPVLVHFPVALSLVAAVTYLLSFLIAGRFLRSFATLSIVLAAAVGVPAFLLGEQAEDGLGRMSEERHEVVEAHEEWGTIANYALIGAAVLAVIGRIASRSRAMRLVVLLALLGVAGVVGYTGYLGGEIVRPGHLEGLF